jgi:N-methylhydantoinase A
VRYLIAADTGGTFTDLAVYDMFTGQTRFGKTLTDYDDLIAGVIRGLDDTDSEISAAALLKHGTTHVINALLERRGAKAALVTTHGFRDVLEIARGNRSVPFDLRYRRAEPLIPRSLRFEVTERIDGQGNVISALVEEEFDALAETLAQQSVDAVAVSFLNSYCNAEHEEMAVRFLKKRLPGIFVTCGTELSREWAEYERTSTAAANAYVGAQMMKYINRFDGHLKRLGFPGKLYMMGSNGGVMTAMQAAATPVAMVESGPVGGCIAAAEYAIALNIPKAIAFDMGGTTAKCALIENGSFDSLATYFVGGYEHGVPIRTPVLDIVEVGAGGGSIAWTDENGRLRVGPQSAGSTPGPIAFRRGGCEPTVTDANLLLGRIGSSTFMNGKLTLDLDAANLAVDNLSQTLMIDGDNRIEVVAQGILDIASVTMAGAVKEISIERGRDVRSYSLIVFGGGGPLFGAELARSLRIGEVIVPPQPGAFSSFGMLLADARQDVGRTFLRTLDNESVYDLCETLESLKTELMEDMSKEFDTSKISFDYEADMRYPNQSHTVRVRLPKVLQLEAISAAFESVYEIRYGHINAALSPQFVMLRVSGRIPTPRPDLESATAKSNRGVKPYGFRSVYSRADGKRVDTPLYRREDLPTGFVVNGPAVVEEYTSTTIVPSGDRLTVGSLGELRISINFCGAEKTHD